jgi:RNA polymerase sigma-70 factor (ECF subfamily)
MSNGAAAPADPSVLPPPYDSAELYREHAPRVARWAAQLGCSAADVEDATQDVFLLAHRESARFRGEARLTTWLYRITLNVMRHHRRKQWLGSLGGSADEVAGHLHAPGPAADDRVEELRAAERLRHALTRLDRRERALLFMVALEDLSGQEIAARTATKPATAWVRLHRARARLRRELQRAPSC